MVKKTVPPVIGPRGGTTTRTKDGKLVRKVFWVGPEEAEALRLAAFQDRRTEASIVREVLRRHFSIGDAPDTPPPRKR